MEAPKRIELTLEEQGQLEERIRQSNLSTADQSILLGVIDFNHWLQLTLQKKKINIKRLQHTFLTSLKNQTLQTLLVMTIPRHV